MAFVRDFHRFVGDLLYFGTGLYCFGSHFTRFVTDLHRFVRHF